MNPERGGRSLWPKGHRRRREAQWCDPGRL